MQINTHTLNLMFIILLSIYFSTKQKPLFKQGLFFLQTRFTSFYGCIVLMYCDSII